MNARQPNLPIQLPLLKNDPIHSTTDGRLSTQWSGSNAGKWHLVARTGETLCGLNAAGHRPHLRDHPNRTGTHQRMLAAMDCYHCRLTCRKFVFATQVLDVMSLDEWGRMNIEDKNAFLLQRSDLAAEIGDDFAQVIILTYQATFLSWQRR